MENLGVELRDMKCHGFGFYQAQHSLSMGLETDFTGFSASRSETALVLGRKDLHTSCKRWLRGDFCRVWLARSQDDFIEEMVC